jgi:hypothetical protein
MARRDEGEYLRSSAEEQRSQTAFCAKTLRAAVLLAAACVGSALTARCGMLGTRAEAHRALAAAKISSRSALQNFKTGS